MSNITWTLNSRFFIDYSFIISNNIENMFLQVFKVKILTKFVKIIDSSKFNCTSKD